MHEVAKGEIETIVAKCRHWKIGSPVWITTPKYGSEPLYCLKCGTPILMPLHHGRKHG